MFELFDIARLIFGEVWLDHVNSPQKDWGHFGTLVFWLAVGGIIALIFFYPNG